MPLSADQPPSEAMVWPVTFVSPATVDTAAARDAVAAVLPYYCALARGGLHGFRRTPGRRAHPAARCPPRGRARVEHVLMHGDGQAQIRRRVAQRQEDDAVATGTPA